MRNDRFTPPLLAEGLLIAPAAAFADTLPHALMLCFMFCGVTAPTVLLSALLPRRMPYALRILSYSLIAALVYLPAALAAEELFREAHAGSVYLPLVASGLLLTTEHDRFFRANTFLLMLRRLLGILFGAGLTLLAMGALRELLGAGSLNGLRILRRPPLPVLLTPACGLLMLGGLCALRQALFVRSGEEAQQDAANLH